MCHPQIFKELAGEVAYNELLQRPRVITSYDADKKALTTSKKQIKSSL
jgi:hypothetical protein